MAALLGVFVLVHDVLLRDGDPAVEGMKSDDLDVRHGHVTRVMNEAAVRVASCLVVPDDKREQTNLLLRYFRQYGHVDHLPLVNMIYDEEKLALASFIATSFRNKNLNDGLFRDVDVDQLLQWLRPKMWLLSFGEEVSPEVLAVYKGEKVPVFVFDDDGELEEVEFLVLTDEEKKLSCDILADMKANG